MASEPALPELVARLRAYPGLTRKNPVAAVFRHLVLQGTAGPQLPNYGDDAAVIPHGDHYLLLACDGIMTGLLLNEPYAAGKAAVMVVVNDIYAMGGRPLAMVNVLASGIDQHRDQVVAGIAKGCRKLGVPMVGGHLHPDAPEHAPALSLAILGTARKLLRSHLARPGHDLIAAVDLAGRKGCATVTSWDANSGKSPEELRRRLEVLPAIAEAGLAAAAKDVSNGGLVGTAAIMMENSAAGAEIDLEAIPRPPRVTLAEWVTAFMSYGFVLSCEPRHRPEIIARFQEVNIAAAAIGRVTDSTRVTLHAGGRSATLFDFSREAITGIRRPPDP